MRHAVIRLALQRAFLLESCNALDVWQGVQPETKEAAVQNLELDRRMAWLGMRSALLGLAWLDLVWASWVWCGLGSLGVSICYVKNVRRE